MYSSFVISRCWIPNEVKNNCVFILFCTERVISQMILTCITFLEANCI